MDFAQNLNQNGFAGFVPTQHTESNNFQQQQYPQAENNNNYYEQEQQQYQMSNPTSHYQHADQHSQFQQPQFQNSQTPFDGQQISQQSNFSTPAQQSYVHGNMSAPQHLSAGVAAAASSTLIQPTQPLAVNPAVATAAAGSGSAINGNDGPIPPPKTVPTADGNSMHIQTVLERAELTQPWGFTPFKYSMVDARSGKDGLDFRELLETCAFASFGGLPIQEVVENSPAARAQCQAWDVVVAINGEDIRGKSGAESIARIKDMTANDRRLTLLLHRSARPRAAPKLTAVSGWCFCCPGPTAPPKAQDNPRPTNRM